MAPTQMITPTQGEIPSKLHKPQSSIRLLRLRCIKWSAATIHLPQSTLPNLTKRTRELLRPSPARPLCSYGYIWACQGGENGHSGTGLARPEGSSAHRPPLFHNLSLFGSDF